jgi:hypothetical protein
MIGVGFGRRGNREGPHGPEINPFLHLDGAGHNGLRRGYIVSGAGVQLGLTGADPGDGYVTVPLSRDDALQDWSSAPACIGIDDRTPACGTVLPDTGVTGMFLTLPANEEQASADSSGKGQGLLSGSKVTISLAPGISAPGNAPGNPPGDAPKNAPAASVPGIASYSFRIGDVTNPLSPARVTLVGRGDRPTYVNTGVHLFNGFDYLFDADKGIVGYRWNGRISAR